MKYNRKQIMNRAWQIKNANSEYIFGECLKIAWAEAKAAQKYKIELGEKIGTEKQKLFAESLVKGFVETVKSNCFAGCNFDENGKLHMVSKNDAELFDVAFLFISFGISRQRTYAGVISALKNDSAIDIAKRIAEMTPTEKSSRDFVMEQIKKFAA